jgi:hypothetical protein
VPRALRRRLVLKELADNALDSGAEVEAAVRHFYVTALYSVRDDGPGIDGTSEDIARLFSINRPMVSSKLWRMRRKENRKRSPRRRRRHCRLQWVATGLDPQSAHDANAIGGRQHCGQKKKWWILNRHADRDRVRSGDSGRPTCADMGTRRDRDKLMKLEVNNIVEWRGVVPPLVSATF